MIITCWGSRGSIPVSGKEYLKYGGDTTCLEIRTKSDDIIILDAGTGIRRLGNKLIDEERYTYHFIITHAHWDHLMGYPFFKPNYYRQARFRMHRCPFPKKFMENMIIKVMAPPNFPVRYSEIKAEIIYEEGCPTEFNVGSVTIIPIPLSHPNMGSGYKFIEDGKTFVFLTDNELGYIHPGGRPYKDYVSFAKGADILFHDGEYTEEEYEAKILWGHSSYTEALNLALDAEVKQFGLFHHNQERTDAELDGMVAHCKDIISERNRTMGCFAVGTEMVFEL